MHVQALLKNGLESETTEAIKVTDFENVLCVPDRHRLSFRVASEDSHRVSARVSLLDPLRDGRWGEFLERHPNASVFHTRGWLEALRRTYGHEPIVVTTAEGTEPLRDGIVVCKVRCWASGDRLVSLPFSDHCDPLVDDIGQMEALISFLKEQVERGPYQSFEMRPLRSQNVGISEALELKEDKAFVSHSLDLSPPLTELYGKFHKNCVQRKIRRAEREGLHYEEGCSDELLAKFYKLLLQTRRRQHLPPQSPAWFRNLADCLGTKFKVRVASKDHRPVASIITIRFRNTEVYKYGCSDASYHPLGGMILLLWHAIQDAKEHGAKRFDFGRSEQDNKGLITFKGRWGATKAPLSYHHYPACSSNSSHSEWKMWLMNKACVHLSDPLLQRLGTVLYKYAGPI